MPNTQITKDKLKTHFEYGRTIYIVGMIVFMGLAGLIYTMCTNKSPANEVSVNIALVKGYSDTAKLEAAQTALLSAGRAYDETLEAVSFISITYDGDATTEDGYYGAQVYTVQLYAGDNDIFIQNETMTNELVNGGACLALEELPWFESFSALVPEGAIIWMDEPSAQTAEDEAEDTEGEQAASPAPQHAYAVDISALTGFIDLQAMDNRGMYASILTNSKNADTSLYVLGEMFTVFAPAAETEAAK